MKTQKLLGSGMLAALLAFSPSIVKANLYDFSYQSLPFLSPVFATGSFTTSDTLIPDIDVYGDSGYKIIGITGERNGVAIGGLVPDNSF